MSRTFLTSTTVTLTALACAIASSGCGTDAPDVVQTAAAPTARSASALDGLYTAPITGPQLRRTLPRLHVAAGTWALRIDMAARTVRLVPPEGGDITLRVESADASRLRLAPDTACESRAGRTVASRFAWFRTADGFVRLQPLRAPCRSVATILTSAPWRAAWPATSLATP